MAEVKINFPVFMGIDQSAEEVPLAMSPNAQNVDTRRGTLRRCLGYANYLDVQAPDNITCLMKLNRRSGTAFEEILIAATSDAIYYYDKSSAQWQTVISDHNSALYSYMNYQLGNDDIIIMSNGADFPVKWDGTNPGGADARNPEILMHNPAF